MKKYVLFALIALFWVSSHSAWAQYVKVTENGNVSWVKIEGTISEGNIVIYKTFFQPAIDYATKGAIDLSQVWSESGGKGTHYQVTGIGDHAFYTCSGLTSITIPSSVTSIGTWAFYGCSGLKSLTIPSAVTKIDNFTFLGCSGLKSVNIPSNVTSIGMCAFSGCS